MTTKEEEARISRILDEYDKRGEIIKAQAQEIERLTKLIGLDTEYMEAKDVENERLKSELAEEKSAYQNLLNDIAET